MIGWSARLGTALLAASLAAVPAIAPLPGLSLTSGPAAVAGTWRWPLRPVPDRVVRDFDPPAQPWLPGNRGVDLAGRPGERVRSSGAGIVTFAGTIANVGVVTVTSGPLRTTYEPLRVRVRRGQSAVSGTVLGTLTLTGSHCLPAACLHWGLLRGDAYLDPLALLGLEQVRLLPLD